ncbi:MAG: DUF433 domain-containing protein [Bryobacterales bacterium]|nr:DUF433 domain-containing protein [Bryobacterales bacterium]
MAGTGVSVRRIAVWHDMGLIPEEIARKFGHLSLAQVHAAVAYYYSTKTETIQISMPKDARWRRSNSSIVAIASGPNQDLHRRGRDGQRFCHRASLSGRNCVHAFRF